MRSISLIVAITQVVYVLGSGKLDILMVNHTNLVATYGNNVLCDAATGLCDPYFSFCLDHFMGNDNPESCLYSLQTTGFYADQPSVIFSSTFLGGAVNPFTLAFNTIDEDHVMLKVDVWDEDVDNTWIDQYNVFLPASNPAPGLEYATWTYKTVLGSRPNDKTGLTFSFRLYCDDEWFGSDCASYCAATINPLDGHFTCDEQTGDKICHPGWADPSTNCTTNIDECASSPCLNLGYCQDLEDSYRCVCLQGVNGTHCEDNINECLSNPCLNGGTCTDDFDGYICDCTLNFFGQNCEEDRPKQDL